MLNSATLVHLHYYLEEKHSNIMIDDIKDNKTINQYGGTKNS